MAFSRKGKYVIGSTESIGSCSEITSADSTTRTNTIIGTLSGGQGISMRDSSPRLRAAVVANDVVKSYGSGTPILNNFSMNVPQGTIYSLLGSSGCGKTTLLSCVVGLKQIQSGEILVFGSAPGSKGSGIPGRRVGYMPQDISLYNDFSIAESLRYFGTLFGMTSSDIEAGQEFLVKFLNLPNPSRLVGQLSGGQRRRVSLAVSLIHSPDLLILDEPTVGVDPLLRESIWNHLCHLVRTRNTTIIITTHYIEEARQSNTIGLMRNGRLLAEKSPTELLEEHDTALLEDIVLKLCKNDSFGDHGENSHLPSPANITEERDTQSCRNAVDEISSSKTSYRRRMSTYTMEKLEDQDTLGDIGNRIRALILKNVTVMMRNYILILFIIILPTIQITSVCLALGGDPKPLKFGVVNPESDCSEPVLHLGGCDVENLSCHFLSNLPNDTIFTYNYQSTALARQDARKGNVWGFMSFPSGYSDNLFSRFSSGNIVDNETLDGSQIYLEIDFSNKQVATTIKRLIYDSYKIFIREMLTECGFTPELGEHPIKFLTPIYGTDDTNFKDFLAPSFLTAVMLFFPLISSGMSFIWDKRQGTMERALVAGVKTWEIMLAFLVTDGVILLIQQVVCFIIVTFGFQTVVHGSLITACALLTMMGVTGVSLGYLIGSICDKEIEAALLTLTVYFPNIILSGVMWPPESMPTVVKYFSYILPNTLPAEAFRSVMNRGWGATHPNVWPGFAIMLFWILFCWLGTVVVNKHALLRK